MAHEATHAPKEDGAVHAHISSAGFYMMIFAALIGLTILTVGQSYVDLGRANLIVVILIATTKASLVVSFFMHLRYDNKFNALIFISCIFFIGIFFAYTMNDTERRGELDADQNVKILQKTGEEAPGGFVPNTPASGHADEHGAAPAPSGAAPAGGDHH
ncbi:MAG: cytochrome C oxidase subunit IV family protein [Labilithrix sp.]|nr:cytochrome C oxidase subunit IV family protein [Labilithrix sp.]MCW5815349.1 cytochrome C oxidase subunit IV family protein [Labilithrix sp.]